MVQKNFQAPSQKEDKNQGSSGISKSGYLKQSVQSIFEIRFDVIKYESNARYRCYNWEYETYYAKCTRTNPWSPFKTSVQRWKNTQQSEQFTICFQNFHILKWLGTIHKHKTLLRLTLNYYLMQFGNELHFYTRPFSKENHRKKTTSLRKKWLYHAGF